MDQSRDTGHPAVVGVCAGLDEANRAIADLRAVGFRDGQLGILTRDTRRNSESEPRLGLPSDPTYTRWEEGSGIGAAVGGAAGLGLGLAVVAGLLPAIGPVIAGGTLVALLASAGAGAVAGTVVGALIGLGVPEDAARWYEDQLAAGRVIVVVQNAGGRAAEAQRIFQRHGLPADPATPIGVYGTGVGATPY